MKRNCLKNNHKCKFVGGGGEKSNKGSDESSHTHDINLWLLLVIVTATAKRGAPLRSLHKPTRAPTLNLQSLVSINWFIDHLAFPSHFPELSILSLQYAAVATPFNKTHLSSFCRYCSSTGSTSQFQAPALHRKYSKAQRWIDETSNATKLTVPSLAKQTVQSFLLFKFNLV